jgi:hypothetical protein
MEGEAVPSRKQEEGVLQQAASLVADFATRLATKLWKKFWTTDDNQETKGMINANTTGSNGGTEEN